MKIVIAQQKGGTAKSTTALLLAVILDKAGKEFEIIDLDPQKSLTGWIDTIGLKSTRGANYQIIDTPPSVFDTETEKALNSADTVIVPSGTSVSELQVTATTLPTIKGRTKAPVRVLWSRVQSNTTAGKSLDELSQHIGADTFKQSIALRQCYQQDFIMEGWKGLNAPARDEASAFVLEVIA